MNAGKALVAGTWLFCVISFAMPGDWRAASLGQTIFWVMLVAHALECIAFQSTLKQAPGPLSAHVVQTMIFGLFYLREIRQAGSTPGENR